MKNRFLFIITTFLLGGSLLLTTSCNKDDDDGGGDPQEVITTVVLTFTDNAGNASIFESKDTDGLGGNAPVIDDIELAANTDYTLTVEFLDESDASDVEDITEEVEEEDLEHLVCFTVQGDMPEPAIQDKDSAGDPLGLESTFSTGAAGSGNLTVILKHEPDKADAAPCSTGETDVETTFAVAIL